MRKKSNVQQGIQFEIVRQWEYFCQNPQIQRPPGCEYETLNVGKGRFPYSELAMHVRLAGRPIVAYSLRKDRKFAYAWAEIRKDDKRKFVFVLGLPGEVLSDEIMREEGLYGQPATNRVTGNAGGR